ncbi:MAG: hypothetical protein US30_C0004G0019 [Candidatus Moranbacteria bacterium GW2011_GWF2_36_839]|nr:MAG: hypothetical protein US27_C0002G0022 [Candidatus Moranbacteria bacterium GW2011_GWF1_36_78]KKQ17275.1 MAG: hypothetical protein US30_C0004G0019 [Candidatus Moranbacteria bacterium GW2011_GWF2_36_839]HAT73882.1 hypothetical protein [Candidatus Moranbacteria bacterium]HBY10975.1 hypothetical protein [Candidatus Moranbacteria bacterium]
MTDGIKSNLEPIEEGDLNLKEKFTGGGKVENVLAKKNEETFPTPEKIERKEGVVEKEATYSKILSKIPATNQNAHVNDVATDAALVNDGIDAESKIENLIKIAQAKSIAHAVNVARHMEDNYILDEFHDRMLGEELHNALVAKGMIKEI